MSYEDVVAALRRIVYHPDTPVWIKMQIEEALRDLTDVLEEKDIEIEQLKALLEAAQSAAEEYKRLWEGATGEK